MQVLYLTLPRILGWSGFHHMCAEFPNQHLKQEENSILYRLHDELSKKASGKKSIVVLV